MTTHSTPAEPAVPRSGAPSRPLPQHAVRAALLDLIAEWGSITSNQAAQMLRQSSGTCSFHLRQLARHGLIEEAPTGDGRSRPWRLRWEGSLMPPEPGPSATGRTGGDLTPQLATELEDGSYRRWLANRSAAPAEWQRDQTSSDVLHLTSDELADLGAAVRALLAPYRQREPRTGTHPVAAVTRLYPLLAGTGEEAEAH
ncbi:winged helix-turn-helix domain-containing protein [Kitasatospora purpeofusca]|uniref:winged helix-turn-helix domain-containing protein n=1 Tax=Kitasatospora purpeofusca TaxID=67352 RepID=UPI002A5A41E9|nr:helix-turn-helix domain-containing protein [Kitasatospora purpeofusca]MDY0810841.1 helix-turn-helix domain-containing protein [Kitasatospora purpeofusca]